jgi:replicative DNA helicase
MLKDWREIMHENQVEIIAGRPSTGKTLLASQICRENVSCNLSTLYFSLELTVSYITERFGIPKEVIIIDDPNLTWQNIKDIILKYKPNCTIIDYLQLIKNNTSNLINEIIQDHQNFTFNNKMVVLSQISQADTSLDKMQIHGKLHNSNLSIYQKDVTFTALYRNTYKI